MVGHSRNWPVIAGLVLISIPLLVMYIYLFVDTVTDSPAGSVLPNRFTLEHWRFLTEGIEGKGNIWKVTLNTAIFASVTTTVVLLVSSLAGYALSRLNVPMRRYFLAGVLMLHAFPSVTLIIAIFLILQMVGLYNTLIGVILVKSTLELPLGIWIMKGFYDTVPWEIEMAGIVDGASRFRVWRSLVLPQVLAPSSNVQVLSVYLASLIADDQHFDFNLFKSVGMFYIIPVIILYIFFQNKLMNIYGGWIKG